jgi:LmbE family N-acetylglucosaminyl deacetylase
MSYNAIAECYGEESRWFSAVVVTDGSGSPRAGEYATVSNEEMQKLRQAEQDEAAAIGEYSAVVQLGYPSKSIINPESSLCVIDIAQIIEASTPEYLYTHNLADKHDSHVAVTLRVLEALRLLPNERRPRKVYAMEVWRSLDWLDDKAKVIFDTSAEPELAEKILSVFASQCDSGKRYDRATLGRRHANATFYDSHASDTLTSCTYGMDITELIDNPDTYSYIARHIDALKYDVLERIVRVK